MKLVALAVKSVFVRSETGHIVHSVVEILVEFGVHNGNHHLRFGLLFGVANGLDVQLLLVFLLEPFQTNGLEFVLDSQVDDVGKLLNFLLVAGLEATGIPEHVQHRGDVLNLLDVVNDPFDEELGLDVLENGLFRVSFFEVLEVLVQLFELLVDLVDGVVAPDLFDYFFHFGALLILN